MGANRLVGPRSDLFALAAMAYRVLAGAPPFRADTVPQLLYSVCEEAPPRPSSLATNVPDHVDLVLLRAQSP